MTTLRISFEVNQVVNQGKDFIELEIPSFGSPKICAYAVVVQNDDVKSAKYILVTSSNKLDLGGEQR